MKKVYCENCKYLGGKIVLYCTEEHKGEDSTPLKLYECASDEFIIKNKNNDCKWFEAK
jgi:hypothetical protein